MRFLRWLHCFLFGHHWFYTRCRLQRRCFRCSAQERLDFRTGWVPADGDLWGSHYPDPR